MTATNRHTTILQPCMVVRAIIKTSLFQNNGMNELQSGQCILENNDKSQNFYQKRV